MERREHPDPSALKALAHQLRQRILQRLLQHGPATSAMLAEVFGEDRGATSYHLRQLAKHEFIEVDEERSAGRRKFWRAVPQDLRVPDTIVDEAADEAGRIQLEHTLDELGRYWRAGPSDLEWADAAMISHSALRLTKDELAELGEKYVELILRRNRPAEDAPAEARPVTVLFAAFPTPEGK